MNNKHCLLAFLALLSACSQEEPTKNQEQLPTNNSRSFLEIVEGSDLGLNFIHDASFSDEFSIYEPLGSGVAILDYDNDGDIDIFIPQYGSNKGFSKLYKNNQMEFIDVTQTSGLAGLDDLIFASVADINNNGYSDLLVGGKNKLSLWLNQGNGEFVQSPVIMPAKGKQFYTGASWFDLNRDGFLDAWVTNYVDDTLVAHCKSSNGDRDYCPPKSYQELSDLLLVNNQGKSFDIQLIESNLGEVSPALGVVSDDFDNNGWMDIYLANDGEANQLFYNFNGILSSDSARISGAAFNLMGASEASMGIAVGDVDNNGYSDLYVTHFKGETNTFYLNNKGIFTDKTASLKLVRNVRPVTGFGTLLIDYNIDNNLDIITVNGSTQYNKLLSGSDRLLGEPIQFWQNLGNVDFKFDSSLRNNLNLKVGRGLASVDFDNDGDYDLIINNNNQPLSVVINNANPSQWLGIIPICMNRIDYGAKLEITNIQNTKSLYRTVHTDGSFASSIDARILIYKANDYNVIKIKWNASQKTKEFKISELKINSYNKIVCKP
jgi:hypothetical protein